MSGWDWGIVLGVIGIVLTVYFGTKALKARKTQKQAAGNRAVAIQSGRDTHIGNK